VTYLRVPHQRLFISLFRLYFSITFFFVLRLVFIDFGFRKAASDTEEAGQVGE